MLLLIADNVYFLYVTIFMLQNLTNDSFSVDPGNTSIEIYMPLKENGSLEIVSGFLKHK